MAGMFLLLLCLSMVSAWKVENEIEQLKESLNTMLKELETAKREFKSFKTESNKEMADLKIALNNCKCQSDEPKEKRLIMPTTTISRGAPVIAFSAWLDHHAGLGDLQTIEYNRVLTNLGGAYDARHGHFTAPVRGIYIISATAVNFRSHDTHIEIVKNGNQLAELFCDSSSYSQASQTLVLELQANDMVWVRHYITPSPVTVIGAKDQPLNTFSGTISTQPQVVAFSAWLDHDVTLGELQAIEYNQVRTNLGGAYDARHGHFTAPIRGVYIISATTLNYKTHEIHLEIVKNGVHLAELYGDPGIHSQSSQTLVIELDANDMVWVRHYRVTSPVTAFGKNDRAHNTFSGVLIAEIN